MTKNSKRGPSKHIFKENPSISLRTAERDWIRTTDITLNEYHFSSPVVFSSKFGLQGTQSNQTLAHRLLIWRSCVLDSWWFKTHQSSPFISVTQCASIDRSLLSHLKNSRQRVTQLWCKTFVNRWTALTCLGSRIHTMRSLRATYWHMFDFNSTTCNMPYAAQAASNPTAWANWINSSEFRLVVTWLRSKCVGWICPKSSFNIVFVDWLGWILLRPAPISPATPKKPDVPGDSTGCESALPFEGSLSATTTRAKPTRAKPTISQKEWQCCSVHGQFVTSCTILRQHQSFSQPASLHPQPQLHPGWNWNIVYSPSSPTILFATSISSSPTSKPPGMKLELYNFEERLPTYSTSCYYIPGCGFIGVDVSTSSLMRPRIFSWKVKKPAPSVLSFPCRRAKCWDPDSQYILHTFCWLTNNLRKSTFIQSLQFVLEAVLGSSDTVLTATWLEKHSCDAVKVISSTSLSIGTAPCSTVDFSTADYMITLYHGLAWKVSVAVITATSSTCVSVRGKNEKTHSYS